MRYLRPLLVPTKEKNFGKQQAIVIVQLFLQNFSSRNGAKYKSNWVGAFITKCYLNPFYRSFRGIY